MLDGTTKIIMIDGLDIQIYKNEIDAANQIEYWMVDQPGIVYWDEHGRRLRLALSFEFSDRVEFVYTDSQQNSKLEFVDMITSCLDELGIPLPDDVSVPSLVDLLEEKFLE